MQLNAELVQFLVPRLRQLAVWTTTHPIDLTLEEWKSELNKAANGLNLLIEVDQRINKNEEISGAEMILIVRGINFVANYFFGLYE